MNGKRNGHFDARDFIPQELIAKPRNYSRTARNPIRQMPLEARMAHLKEHYQQKKVSDNKFSFRWAVMDCCFRYGLNTAQAAVVLDADPEDVQWACEMIRQDAE